MKGPVKLHLLKSYAVVASELREFINSLSEAQLTIPTDEAGWTVKDHLVHIAVWQKGVVALLQSKPRFTAMGLSASAVQIHNYDEINETLRQKYADLPMVQVDKMLHEVNARFVALLKGLKVADLAKPYAFYAKIRKPSETDSQPVFGWIEGNSSHHIQEHLPWMRQIVIDDRAANLTLYGDGCAMLDAALADAPREMWKFRPAEGAWSVHEIIIHLADSELNSYARVRKALTEPGSVIFGYDQDVWAVALDYHRRDTGDALALLRLVRKMTHELLAGQPADIWSRSYFHPEVKRQVTLDAWLGTYAGHIPSHIAQIRANVESWRARSS
jgi:uncharacterized damage-inducible protein DinB